MTVFPESHPLSLPRGPLAELVYENGRARWKGNPEWNFLISGCLLREGKLELWYEFGPFEKVGELADDIFIFRRKRHPR